MFQAVCDKCSTAYENEEYVAWTDAESAEEMAFEAEWRKQDDGRLLCWDCRQKPGGDWYEDMKDDG